MPKAPAFIGYGCTPIARYDSTGQNGVVLIYRFAE